MKIPELRTGEMMLVIKHDSPMALRPSHTIVDENGKVVGIFFGRYANSIAQFCTTFTDAMKLATAARDGQIQPPVETQTEVSETSPSGRGTEAQP